ncbi:acetyltransferase [Arthrobacter phage Truckee]|nr:acetyltransferase [Arthrobacter phage Truckee]
MSSPEEVDDFLAHYGVKGMRWGKRKDSKPREKANLYTASRSTTMKNGMQLELEGRKNPLPSRLIAAMSPSFAKRLNESHAFKLKSPDGKHIGDLHLDQKSPTELNVVWLEVKKKERGQGYAQGAMQASIEMAKEMGMKKVTLEVPGFSPDARHVYEKAGFKVMKEPSLFERKTDTIWGGLTEMQLDL